MLRNLESNKNQFGWENARDNPCVLGARGRQRLKVLLTFESWICGWVCDQVIFEVCVIQYFVG